MKRRQKRSECNYVFGSDFNAQMPVLESVPLSIPEDKVVSQEMDLTDIKSDLHALQKLYGLLKDDGGVSPTAMPEMLDNKARHMLKNLLDAATERVFKVHSEIIRSYVSESFSTQQQLHDDPVNQKFPVQANPSNILVKSFGDDMKDTKFSSQKEEQRLSNPASQSPILKQSSMTFTSSGFPDTKKRCKICQRSTVKQLKSTSFFSDKKPQYLKKVSPLHYQTKDQGSPFFWRVELDKGLQLDNQCTEPTRNAEKERQVGDDITSCNLNHAGSTIFSVNRDTVQTDGSVSPSSQVKSESVPKCRTETMENTKGGDYLSKEASEAIKEIESRILALQIDAENLGPPRKRAAQRNLSSMSTSFVPITDPGHCTMQMEAVEARDTDLSHTAESVGIGNEFLLHAVNRGDHKLKNAHSPIKIPTRSLGQEIKIKFPNMMVNQLSKPFPQTQTMMSQLESQNVGDNSRFSSGCNMLRVGRKPVAKPSLQSWKLNQASRQNAVPNEQMPRRMSKVNWPTALPGNFPSQINKENQDDNQVDWNEQLRKFLVVDSAHKVYPARMARHKKHLPGKLPKQASMLDRKPIQPSFNSASYNTWVDEHELGVLKNNKPKKQVRKILMDHEESESRTSDSDSPSWASQQLSTCYNESEEYSISRGMQSDPSPSSSSGSEAYSLPHRNQDHYMSATSSSENDVYSLPHRNQDHYMSATSSSENEVYSSASGIGNDIYSSTSSTRTSQLTPTNSNETDRYSPHVRPGMYHDKANMCSSDNTASRRRAPSGVQISTDRQTTKKQSGRLKKLKDKLAIILHHHHHHHHHLHPGDESDRIGQQAKISHGKALWKRSKKLAYPKRERETYGEQAIEKLGKSTIRDGPRKNQHRHFHELVKGVLRHIRHSKKSKSSKEAMKRLERTRHGNKKAFKKSHWWQLQRSHRGAKMPKKENPKLGFDNKKNAA